MSRSPLPYDTALMKVLEACAPLPHEDCPVGECLGRILAEPVASPVNLPPFDNSAKDGFALAGGEGPVPAGTELDVGGEQAAGDGLSAASEGAWEIMTGARLPDGFDRVVPVECTQTLATGEDGRPTRIRLTEAVPADDNVRHAGTDVRRDAVVLPAGAVVEPRHLMLLAGLGIASARVIARPRAAVICTGRELVDDPAQPLQPGQIRNANGPFLAAQLAVAGAQVVHVETVGDDANAFEAALRRALEAGAQIVLSTGAVSMGRYDFVPQSLERIGATTIFHKVAIRPGKPLLLARLPNGALMFGLPGNPIAGAVGLRFFVEPALRAMAGLPTETPRRVPLARPFRKGPKLRLHLKSRLRLDDHGQLSVEVLDGQESYRIHPLAETDVWAIVPAEIDELPAGALVDVYGLSHLTCPLPRESVA
jgi:molybdopterin molybdotransferase